MNNPTKTRSWAIVDKDGTCSTLSIPALAGDVHIVPIFLRLKDAKLTIKSLPTGHGRRIAEMKLTMTEVQHDA